MHWVAPKMKKEGWKKEGKKGRKKEEIPIGWALSSKATTNSGDDD